MIPSRTIERKRDGEPIDRRELEGFLDAYLDGDVQDYHMAAFLMATFFRGLSGPETETLVRAMLTSGSTLDLSALDGPRVDKHSTGGVGDKVSLALAPLAAECGIRVPMMSGRGLGHTAGTLDKLEAIPGFRTSLALEEFVAVLERVGCAMIGQTAEIAPLDRRLYALRDVTGTVPVLPLIAASIMSKKLAEDLDGLVLDVKVGSGAFIPEEERALGLAGAMVDIGRSWGLTTVALLTAMDRPLGRAVGNGLETAEAIRLLAGEGPRDLEELVLTEVAEMLMVGGLDAGFVAARARARAALDSGRAFERFVVLVEAQGGDASVVDRPERLETAPVRRTVDAWRDGTVIAVEPRALGEGVVALGGGRRAMEDRIHPGVGFAQLVQPGERVDRGDALGVVHAKDAHDADLAADVLRNAVRLGEGAPETRPLVSHRVTMEGVEPAG